MPAVLSAIFSAIYAAIATEGAYKSSLYTIFPAMQPASISIVNATMHNETMSVEDLFGVIYLIFYITQCAIVQITHLFENLNHKI